jgi:uncharacterized membrane protein
VDTGHAPRVTELARHPSWVMPPHSSGTDDPPRMQRWDTARVETFSDGVFAIAITLLVLEIHVDDFDHLARALLHQWPAYLAYVTSFLTVGSVWIAHHGLFTRLRLIDPVLLRINLVLLMAAAFLPFPTAVLAESFHEGHEAERIAVVFYGASALVIELLLRAAVGYAGSRPELAEPGQPAHHERGSHAVISSILYSLGILIGVFVFPRVAAVAYLIVAARGVFVVGGEGRLGLRRL